eukprot:g16946.t1
MSASSNTSTKEPAATNLGRKSKSKGESADTLEQQSPASGNSSAQRDCDAARVLEVSQELKASSKLKSGDSRKNEQRLVYNVRLLLSLLFVKQGSNAYKEKNTMGKVIIAYLCWGLHTGWCETSTETALGLPQVYKKKRRALFYVVVAATIIPSCWLSVQQLAASLEMFQLPRQLAASKAPTISIEEKANLELSPTVATFQKGRLYFTYSIGIGNTALSSVSCTGYPRIKSECRNTLKN